MPKKNDALPPLPSGSPGKPAADRYREQYAVIVLCRDEAHHQKVYEALRDQGYKCRVVRT